MKNCLLYKYVLRKMMCEMKWNLRILYHDGLWWGTAGRRFPELWASSRDM